MLIAFPFIIADMKLRASYKFSKGIVGKKALYKHKRSGDLFAIETDDGGAFN